MEIVWNIFLAIGIIVGFCVGSVLLIKLLFPDWWD